MGFFKQARAVSKVSSEYKRLAGLRDESMFQYEVEQFARIAGTSMSEVMVVGIAAMKASDRMPQPNTLGQWDQIFDIVADQVSDGALTFASGEQAISGVIDRESTNKIINEVLKMHRKQWQRLGIMDRLRREYAIVSLDENPSQQYLDRIVEIEGFFRDDFDGASPVDEQYFQDVRNGDLYFTQE